MRVDGIVGLERAELARAKHREGRITDEAEKAAAAAPRHPGGGTIVAGDGARVMVNDHDAGGGGGTIVAGDGARVMVNDHGAGGGGGTIVAGDGARVMVNDHGAGGGGGATELELALLLHVGDETAGAAPELDLADRSEARGVGADVSSAARARAAGRRGARKTAPADAGEPPGDLRLRVKQELVRRLVAAMDRDRVTGADATPSTRAASAEATPPAEGPEGAPEPERAR